MTLFFKDSSIARASSPIFSTTQQFSFIENFPRYEYHHDPTIGHIEVHIHMPIVSQMEWGSIHASPHFGRSFCNTLPHHMYCVEYINTLARLIHLGEVIKPKQWFIVRGVNNGSRYGVVISLVALIIPQYNPLKLALISKANGASKTLGDIIFLRIMSSLKPSNANPNLWTNGFCA